MCWFSVDLSAYMSVTLICFWSRGAGGGASFSNPPFSSSVDGVRTLSHRGLLGCGVIITVLPHIFKNPQMKVNRTPWCKLFITILVRIIIIIIIIIRTLPFTYIVAMEMKYTLNWVYHVKMFSTLSRHRWCRLSSLQIGFKFSVFLSFQVWAQVE